MELTKILDFRARLFKTNNVFVNVSLNFQTPISEKHQYFLLKKCEKMQKLLSFFQQKKSVY